MTVQDWLGADNKLGIDIWEKKYRFNNETFDEWLDRVSGGDEELRQLIVERKFLFGGRTLSNRGTGKSGSFSNCYSRGFIEDSLSDIMQANTDIAETFKAQGGQGVSLSKLRPKGCGINNGQFKSDGIIPFMEVYNTTTESISQGGSRKGALIISLDAWHKEAPEFITIKTETGKIQKANLSLEIDDEFMECVKKYYETGEEITKTIKRTYGHGEYIEYEVTPIKLYKKMMEAAYDWAEPGCIFTDRFRNYNMMQCCDDYQVETCNPSLRAGTLVLTSDGPKPIETLEGQRFITTNIDGESVEAECFLSGRNKRLYKITLDNNEEIYCTPEHKWPIHIPDGYKKKETTELKVGDRFLVPKNTKLSNGTLGTYEDGMFFGYWYGDGCVTGLKDGGTQYGFTFGCGDKMDFWMPFVVRYISNITGREYSGSRRNRGGNDWVEIVSRDASLGKHFEKYGITSKHHLPTEFYSECSEEFRRGFIDGLFSADSNVSTVKKAMKITLTTANCKFAKEVQNLLAWYGIKANNFKIVRTLDLGSGDKEYTRYDVTISAGKVKHFLELFKFSSHSKQESAEYISEQLERKNVNNTTYQIKNIELTDICEDVWDIHVYDNTHTFSLNYCITGNCGEQPLPKHGACVGGDTLVALPDRVTTIEKLLKDKNAKYILSNDNKFRTFYSVVDKGAKQAYKLTLSNGLSIIATGDHRFETTNGIKELKDLNVGSDYVVVKNGFNMSAYGDNDELYEMFGWMHGDGWMTGDAVGISFNRKDGDFDAKDRLLPIFKNYFDCNDIKPLKDDDVSYQLQITGRHDVVEKCKELGFVFGHTCDRVLPTAFYDWTLTQQLSFIRGLFASDGNVQGKALSQVFLYSSSEKLVEQVQKFLASIGIHSSFYKTIFSGETTMGRSPQYKIGISKQSANLFMDIVGFNGHKKGDRFVASRYKDEDSYAVKSVEDVGTQNVYDILDVDRTNMFFANGMSVHNCNLASINLSEFVTNPFTTDAKFDDYGFKRAVWAGIRALDTVLDENLPNHPLKEQREMAEKYRNVGLGIMGLHDALIKLGIKYGSPDSIRFVDKIMSDMFVNAVLESSRLAEEKGRFPMYKDELLDSDIIKAHFSEDDLANCDIRRTGLRNCSLLSIAPTGSLGTMLNISTGCEPLFALYYNRKTESLNGGEDKYYKVYSGVVKDYVERHGENLPDYLVCSGDINWRDRVAMQAVLQNHVDTAISSTINLPNEIGLAEIEELYLYSWESGLKGVTIFRDGCKRVGILSTGDTVGESSDTDELKRGDVVKADNDCVGLKRTLYTGCGTLHCEAFFDPRTGELRETYFSKGSSGGCNNFMIGLSRMISLASRGGVGLDYIVDQLKSSGTCPSYAVRAATKKDTSKGSSCPVAIGNALISMHDEFLEKYVTKAADKDCKKSETKIVENSTVSGKCPVCGEALVFEGGCNTCKSCGWSKCE